MFPGQPEPTVPEKSQTVGGDRPSSFHVFAEEVRQARETRISREHEAEIAFGHPERAEVEAVEARKRPFYGTLIFTGCIDYRDAEGDSLYYRPASCSLSSPRPMATLWPVRLLSFSAENQSPTPDRPQYQAVLVP